MLWPSVDHVTPLSRGGADDATNLQLVHYGCNQAKGSSAHPAFPEHARRRILDAMVVEARRDVGLRERLERHLKEDQEVLERLAR